MLLVIHLIVSYLYIVSIPSISVYSIVYFVFSIFYLARGQTSFVACGGKMRSICPIQNGSVTQGPPVLDLIFVLVSVCRHNISNYSFLILILFPPRSIVFIVQLKMPRPPVLQKATPFILQNFSPTPGPLSSTPKT